MDVTLNVCRKREPVHYRLRAENGTYVIRYVTKHGTVFMFGEKELAHVFSSASDVDYKDARSKSNVRLTIEIAEDLHNVGSLSEDEEGPYIAECARLATMEAHLNALEVGPVLVSVNGELFWKTKERQG